MRRPARMARSGPKRPSGIRTLPPRPSLDARPADLSSLLTTALNHHQAGRFGEAERLYRQVLSLNPEQPDALHLLGIVHLQGGRPEIALPLIERAIARQPAAASFHLNLGNVLLALGRRTDAVASYRRAAALDPADPEAPNNLGNALIQDGQLEDGIAALQQAVQLKPDHVSALSSLGKALGDAERHEEAVAAFLAVVRLRPDDADACTRLAVSHHALGHHDDARIAFERVVSLQPNDEAAQVNLAEVLRSGNHLEDAASWYERVLAAYPSHPVALSGLASIRRTQKRAAEAADLLARLIAVRSDDPQAYRFHARSLGDDRRPDEAMRTLIDGLARHPDHRPLIVDVVELLETQSTDLHNPVVRAALLAACTDDTFSAHRLTMPLLQIIAADPECRALLGTVRSGADPLAAGVPLPALLVEDPLILAALPRVVFCSPDMERILTAVRRAAFTRATAGTRPALETQPLSRSFLCVLARASFLVEYSWLLEGDETRRVPKLRALVCEALADADRDPADLEDLLILMALYEPLGRLPGAERLLDVPEARWSPELVPVIREQVAERLEEQAIAAALPALTPIDNHVSVAVRSMYEENPYPRWRAARFVGQQPLRARFRQLCPDEVLPDWPTPLPVLIAGSGSGQHPIDVAMLRPEADVLTVDLSRPSLAYGARMARRLGVTNVRFAQADILALDALDQQFALIECAGVLHHLEEPLAGWRVLRRLLRPDGLMKIGLYSERARSGIVAAREMIARTHVPPTTEGIQLARRLLLSLPDQHPAAQSVGHVSDFYSMSGFRDLVMHVQEHRYTLPLLAETLDLLDLDFLGFDVRQPVKDQFCERFPAPGAALDLACWDTFEAEHPDTFLSMYQFWCRPRR